MKYGNRGWVMIAVGAVFAAGAWSTRAQEPSTTDKIKAKVGSAVSTIKQGALNAEEKIKEQYAKATGAVKAMGIEARVYSRIHWDKALSTSKIELKAPKEGVIALNGTVPDEKAKAKAIELTADTIGVVEVVDHLVVRTAATGATISPK